MSIIKKREWWLLLVSMTQLISLAIFDYLFKRDVDHTLSRLQLSLSNNGMAADQVSALVLAIYAMGTHVSTLVYSLGTALILLNLGLFAKIINNQGLD